MSLAGQAKVKISNNYTSIIPVHKNRANCNTVNFGSIPTVGAIFSLNQRLYFFNAKNNAKEIKLAVENRKPPLFQFVFLVNLIYH